MPLTAFVRRLCAAACAATACAALFLIRPAAAPPAESPPAAEPAAQPAKETPPAVLGCFEGRLALYRAGHAAPDEVYDVFVASLPPAEQEALAAGLPVTSEDELQRLLEDYTY